MSFPFYGKMWIATKEDLKNVTLCEKVLRQLEPTMNRNYAHKLIGNLYVKYVILCNNLSELYDQTLQVQKRQLIENLLISSQERMKEIQKDIQKIEMSQFVYVDDNLIELNLVPYDIEFLRPFYFPRKRSFEYQQILDEVPKVENKIVEPPKGLDRFRKILTPEEIEANRKAEILANTINVIKSHEKARQARILALKMRLFPDKFIPKKPPKKEENTYNFLHDKDQVPLFKMKRTKYQIDLYAQPVNFVEYDFYEPPKFRVNKLGKKVLIQKKKTREQISDNKEKEAENNEIVEADEEKLNEEEEILKAEELAENQHNAARVIQRNYLYYQLKKAIKRRKIARMELFGMIEESVDLDVTTASEIHERNQQKRRDRKKEFDEAFRKAVEDKKARILKMKSEFIMEDITNDIREWFREFYSTAKDFHRYPEEFEGGTIMVMRGETKTPEEFLIEKNKTQAEKAREKEMKKKEKKEKKANEKKQKELEKKIELQKKKLEMKQGPTWNFAEMKDWKAFENLESTFMDGQREWQFIDDMENRKEQPIWEWVTLNAYCDVHKELRLIVDNFMRVELELLRVALAIETKTNYVPPKPKKEKKKKKKKEKEIIDVTEGRTPEECYEELKKLGIIKKYEKKSLKDFIGDYNFAASNLRLANRDPPQHYGDIRNYIQNEILGTAVQCKSFCIVGPPKSGKKFLVEAICSEMDAVIFDLSAPKIKQIDDMPYFLNLVLRMAVKFQPSVLFIDGAHKPFIKRITDDIKSEDPRKLGRYLIKDVAKKLTNEDAVMLIGVTNEPWNCNFLQMRQCYEKFSVFPAKLDFGTAVKAWKIGLKLKRIINFDVSSLAQVTRCFSVGDILESIDSCLNLKRRMMLSWMPLTYIELFENLITTKQPIEEKVANEFKKISTMVDPHYSERMTTMARVQIEIDKENEERMKKKEMQKKKEMKKAQEQKNVE